MPRRKSGVVNRQSNLPHMVGRGKRSVPRKFGPELPKTATKSKVETVEKTADHPWEGFRLINVSCLSEGIATACACSGCKRVETAYGRGKH